MGRFGGLRINAARVVAFAEDSSDHGTRPIA